MQRFKEIYNGLIKAYSFKPISVSENEIGLVGKGFILIFAFDLDNVLLFFITRDENNILKKFNIDNFISISFNEEDRKDIEPARTINEDINNILHIILRGLQNHWKDLLEGNTQWMNQYKMSEYYYPPHDLTKEEQEIVNQYI
mgnify:FL=1